MIMKRALFWSVWGFAGGVACGSHLLWALAVALVTTVIGAFQ
jgi:hypothetical protein